MGSANDRRLTAYHEAGHLVASFRLFPDRVRGHVTIVPDERLEALGHLFQEVPYINRLDFACSTDHCYNINPYLWSYLGKLARVNEQPDRFLTFLAEEWTSSFEEYDATHPYGFYGHRNLIFGDTYFPRWWNSRNRQTPAEVWEELRKLNADFVHIPHQLADTGNVPTDWNFTDERAQPVAEIFQTRGSYEYHGTPRQADRTTPPGYFIQDAWARGIVIGVIAARTTAAATARPACTPRSYRARRSSTPCATAAATAPRRPRSSSTCASTTT